MCSIPTATMWRSATSPGFTNNVCASHAPSRRADTPDWCTSFGSCAASRFTADGCRLCCSTPELSAIPKLARNASAVSEANRRDRFGLLGPQGSLSIQPFEGSRFVRGGRYGISIDSGLEVVEKNNICGASFKSKLIDLTMKRRLTIASS
jgi:hypothetical protein